MNYKGQYISSILYYDYNGFGERINLGLLMIFPHTNEVYFRYHKSFKRITCCYPKTKGKHSLLRAIVRGLKIEIDKLNNKNDLGINGYSDPNRWINDKILLIDNSSPRFSDISKGVMYDESAYKVFNDMYNVYFKHLND